MEGDGGGWSFRFPFEIAIEFESEEQHRSKLCFGEYDYQPTELQAAQEARSS